MELGNQLNKKVEDQNLQNKNPQVNKPLSQIQKFQIVKNVLEDKLRHISNNIDSGNIHSFADVAGDIMKLPVNIAKNFPAASKQFIHDVNRAKTEQEVVDATNKFLNQKDGLDHLIEIIQNKINNK